MQTLTTSLLTSYNLQILPYLKPVSRAILARIISVEVPTNLAAMSSIAASMTSKPPSDETELSKTGDKKDTDSGSAATPHQAGTSGRGGRKSRKRKPKNPRGVNHPRKMQRFQQDNEHANITQYVENGMRKIKPYIFVFETHAKGRWIGRTLMDVFKKEFRLETPEYYKTAINGGLIQLNGKLVKADTVIRCQDFLQSRVHRHEPPVSGAPLDIIKQTEDFIVINKPASIPIHPAGKYRHNSIVYLMAKEHGLKGLHTFYRLDRLTSGVFIFARSTEVVKKIDSQMRGRELHKVYLCKVNGEFPSEPLECSEPILAVSYKIGVSRVSSDGKPSKTSFQRVSYDGETSIIKCMPSTGRMHQIRVHLQYLGFPILNDPLYTGPVWGPDQGKQGKIPFATDDEFIAELTRLHNKEQLKLSQQESTTSEQLVNRQQEEQESSKECSDGPRSETCQRKDKVEMRNGQEMTGMCSENVEMSSQELSMAGGGSNLSIDGPAKSAAGNLLECDRTSSGDMQDGTSRTQDAEKSPADGVREDAASSAIDVASNQVVNDEHTRSSGQDAERSFTEGHLVDSTNSAIDVASNQVVNDKHTRSGQDAERSFTDGHLVDSARSAIELASNQRANTELVSSSSQQDTERICKQGKIADPTCDSSNTQGKEPVSKSRLDLQETPCQESDSAKVVMDVQDKPTGDEQSSGRTCKDEGLSASSSCGSSSVQDTEEEALNRLAKELCRDCRQPLPDPEPVNMMLYLHALTYKGPDFEFSTPLPKWAQEHMDKTGSKMP